MSNARRVKLEQIKKREKKRKAIIRAVIAVPCVAVLVFFIVALIYHGKNKDRDKGGINLSGEEVGYSSSVVLGEYIGLTYTPYEINVTDEDVDNYISAHLKESPNIKTDYSRDNTLPADGDKLKIEYTAKTNGITYASDEVIYYDTGSLLFGENFEDVLKSTAVGAGFTVNSVIDESFENDKLAGQDCEITAKLDGVVEFLDYVTDDYAAAESNGEAETAEAYRDYVYGVLLQTEESKAKTDKWNQIWNKLLESCEFSIDEKSVDLEYENMINYYESYAKYINTSFEELVTKAYGYGTLQDFYDYCREYAAEVVKEQVVYDAIIKKEGITVDDATYEARVQKYMEEGGFSSRADFESVMGVDEIEKMIADDLVSELLISNAVEIK